MGITSFLILVAAIIAGLAVTRWLIRGARRASIAQRTVTLYFQFKREGFSTEDAIRAIIYDFSGELLSPAQVGLSRFLGGGQDDTENIANVIADCYERTGLASPNDSIKIRRDIQIYSNVDNLVLPGMSVPLERPLPPQLKHPPHLTT